MKIDFQLLKIGIVVSLVGVHAYAQDASEGSNNLKASEIMTKEETQKNIDQEITNARLRATLGSKSKWSIKTSFNYEGGSVQTPTAEVRPDYQNASDPSRNKPELSNLNAKIGVRYATSERTSVTIGTGLGLQNPFHGDLTRSKFQDPRSPDKTQQRMTVQTPYIDYSYATKLGSDLQMVSSINYNFFTSDNMVNQMNGFGYLGASTTVMGDIGTTGWSAGVVGGFTSYQWNGSPQNAQFAGTQPDFDLYLLPFTEYAFNDKLSFRTVFGWFAVDHLKETTGDRAAVFANVPYQSMGIGISLNRDVYLYPNVQFTPFDIRAERTNVGLSANVNVF